MSLLNLVRVATTTTGTGAVTLGATITGFLSMASAGAVDGTTYSYVIETGFELAPGATDDMIATEREIGTGVWDAGTQTLTRNVINSTNSNALINLDGTGAHVLISPNKADFGSGYQVVVPDGDFLTSFYVDPTGSDVSGDGSSGNPWQTIEYAVTWISQNVFVPSNSGASLFLADGTYAETVYLGGISGGGLVNIRGNSVTPANVLIDGTDACFYQYGPGTWGLNFMKLQCLVAGQAGLISSYGNGGSVFTNGVIFGHCEGGPHVSCPSGGSQGAITVQGVGCKVTGTATYFASASTDGYIEVSHGTLEITVDPAWGAIYHADRFGRIYDGSSNNWTWTNTAGYSGPKYHIVSSGQLHTTDLTAVPGGSDGVCDDSGRVNSADRIIAPRASTFANLPTPPTNGMVYTITDALTINPGQIVSAGGGTFNVLAFYDGDLGEWVSISTTQAFISRVVLTANANFYCSPSGNDTTGDGSIGNPWRNPQTWWDYTINSLDLGGFNSICNLESPGSYDGIYGTVAPVGTGNLVLIGDSSDPSQVVIGPETTFGAFTLLTSGTLWITGLDLGSGGVLYAIAVNSGIVFFGEPSFTDFVTKNIIRERCVGQLYDQSFDITVIDGSNVAHADDGTASGMFETTSQYGGSSSFYGPDFNITGTLTCSQFFSLTRDNITATSGTWGGAANVSGRQYRINLGSSLVADALSEVPGTTPGIFGTDGTFRLSSGSAIAFSTQQQSGERRVFKTANYSPVFNIDLGTQFDNTGASGEVDFTLPTITSAEIGAKFGFCVVAAQTLKVIAPASTSIAIGASNSAAAGNIQSNTPFSYVEIEAISTTQWVAKCSTGSWTVT